MTGWGLSLVSGDRLRGLSHPGFSRSAFSRRLQVPAADGRAADS